MTVSTPAGKRTISTQQWYDALLTYSETGNVKGVCYLLEKGLNISYRNADNQSALTVAIMHHKNSMVLALLANEVKVKEEDLVVAIRCRNKFAVETTLQKIDDPSPGLSSRLMDAAMNELFLVINKDHKRAQTVVDIQQLLKPQWMNKIIEDYQHLLCSTDDPTEKFILRSAIRLHSYPVCSTQTSSDIAQKGLDIQDDLERHQDNLEGLQVGLEYVHHSFKGALEKFKVAEQAFSNQTDPRVQLLKEVFDRLKYTETLLQKVQSSLNQTQDDFKDMLDDFDEFQDELENIE
eukprot:TRINITY_DN448_c0_g1_i3.p1 TRINITY_DN448_c0_g1~~TRINITY_DN448_c0_g1_i3.p1  ORF type:complete len:292 (+),score=46.41 TRINITY_DN448_c0_g1_i3:1042-1917(+)